MQIPQLSSNMRSHLLYWSKFRLRFKITLKCSHFELKVKFFHIFWEWRWDLTEGLMRKRCDSLVWIAEQFTVPQLEVRAPNHHIHSQRRSCKLKISFWRQFDLLFVNKPDVKFLLFYLVVLENIGKQWVIKRWINNLSQRALVLRSTMVERGNPLK